MSGSDDWTIRLWDLNASINNRIIGKHNDWVSSLIVSTSNKFLVSGSSDKTIKLWDIDNS